MAILSKKSRPRGPDFEQPPEGILVSFLHAEVCWSNGVVEHNKISNSKHQITNKSQIPILNDQNRFAILKLGTRPQGGESKRSADNFGHCYLFDICDLGFGISIPFFPAKPSNSDLAQRTKFTGL
jgi:hypothetical protein